MLLVLSEGWWVDSTACFKHTVLEAERTICGTITVLMTIPASKPLFIEE